MDGHDVKIIGTLKRTDGVEINFFGTFRKRDGPEIKIVDDCTSK
jgi:hypothetical protein